MKKGDKKFQSDYDAGCVYLIRNTRNGKSYVGMAKHYRERMRSHQTNLEKYGNEPEEMKRDFRNGDEFECRILCKTPYSDTVGGYKHSTMALEAFFILVYDAYENGYNRTLSYPTIERAKYAIYEHSEFILKMLMEYDMNNVVIKRLLSMDKMDTKNT